MQHSIETFGLTVAWILCFWAIFRKINGFWAKVLAFIALMAMQFLFARNQYEAKMERFAKWSRKWSNEHHEPVGSAANPRHFDWDDPQSSEQWMEAPSFYYIDRNGERRLKEPII